MIELRPYQREAVDAVWRHLAARNDNPCVVIPTAGGKTLILSAICADAVQKWNGRVLVLTHVRELVEQNAAKLNALLGRDLVGVYSAGLKRRDTDHPVIAAGIQSVYRRACDLGPADLLAVDEVHLVPESGEGMYRTFIADAEVINPRIRVIGLTATPYRMTSGAICSPTNILNHVCYEIGVKELILQGYLCPLRTKVGLERADVSRLHVRGGEFVAEEAEQLMDADFLVQSAVAEIVSYTQNRNACLIFAAGVKHAEHIVSVFREVHGIECGLVTGETPATERDLLLRRFRGEPEPRTQISLFGASPPLSQLKYLANVNVLTTGFDAPSIDCVALLRPTMSPGLFYQMCGRGFRLHSAKRDCLVLDFADNILRHGPVDQITVGHRPKGQGGEAPAKVCPQCNAAIAAGYARCPECGYEFPAPEVKHNDRASAEAVLSGEVTTLEHAVTDITYSLHTRRGADAHAPKTMRVEYQIGFRAWVSEWVCPEHTGWARGKFQKWWRERSTLPSPTTAAEAVDLAIRGALAPARKITVRSVSGEKYERIIAYELGERPAYREPGWDEENVAGAGPADDWGDPIGAATADDEFGDIPF